MVCASFFWRGFCLFSLCLAQIGRINKATGFLKTWTRFIESPSLRAGNRGGVSSSSHDFLRFLPQIARIFLRLVVMCVSTKRRSRCVAQQRASANQNAHSAKSLEFRHGLFPFLLKASMHGELKLRGGDESQLCLGAKAPFPFPAERGQKA